MNYESAGWGTEQSGLRTAEGAYQLREKIFAIARLVDDLAENPRRRAEAPTEVRVISILKARRSRAKFFPAGLFADPAWDMLLELYAADLGQRRLSVSALCIGADVPSTTALRWMGLLDERGLVRRRPDPMDGRRVFVSPSPEAVTAMDALFTAVPADEALL